MESFKLLNFENSLIFQMEKSRIWSFSKLVNYNNLENFPNLKFLGMRVKILKS